MAIFERKTVCYGNFKEWLNCCGIELGFILSAAVLLMLLASGNVPQLTDWQCPFLELTGWPCFSCGMTRALTALLQGNLLEAFKFNPLSWLLVGVLFFRLYQRLAATIFKSYLDFRNPQLIWGGMTALVLLCGLGRIIFR